MIPWHDITIVTPADGQQVWIRRLLVEYPIKAVWNDGPKTWTTVTGLTMPWYFVARWRIIT